MEKELMKKSLRIKFLFLNALASLIFTMNANAQFLEWDSTIVLPQRQTAGPMEVFGEDILMTGGGRYNFMSESVFFRINKDGQIIDKDFSTDSTSITEIIQLLKVKNEDFIYGAGDYFIKKLDTSGNTIWLNTQIYPFLQNPFRVIHQLKDKSILAAGYRQFAVTGWDFFVTKIDSLGNTTWQNSYPKMSEQAIVSATEMFDGSFLLCGNDSGRARIIRIDFDGNLIDEYTHQNAPNTVNLIGGGAALTPDKHLLFHSGSNVSGFTNNHQVLLLDSNLNVVFDSIDNWLGATSLHVCEDSSYYFYGLNGFVEEEHYFFNARIPYQIQDSFLISSGGINYKQAIRTKKYDEQSIMLSGRENQSAIDDDYWFAKISGLKKLWVPDPCQLNPPKANFSFDYNYPLLTLKDSSFSGLKYWDSVYTWQWSTSTGQTASTDSISFFFDSAITSTIDIELIISNWYECSDTIRKTIDFFNTGIGAFTKNELKVYPIPSSDFIHFELEKNLQDIAELTVYSLSGSLLDQRSINTKNYRYPLKQLESGTYFYRLTTMNEVFRGKFIVGN